MELEELQAAMLRNQQASGQLAGLDEQYTRANALRDTPQQRNDRYGGVNVLSGFADILRRNRGERDVKALAPQREQARTDIAEGTAAVEGNNLAMAMKKAAEQTASHEDTLENSALTRSLKKAKEERDIHNEGDYSGDTLTFVSPDGKHKVNATRDGDGRLIQENGEPVPDGYIEDQTASGGYRAGQYLKDSTIKEMTESSSQIAKFGNVVDRFEDKFAQQGGMPTNIANKAVAFMTRNDLLEIVADKEMTQDSRDAAQWWADFQMIYSLPRRHEIFGATLTARELSSWDEAVGVMAGMSPEQMKTRLEKLNQDLQNDYKTKINTHMLAKGGSDGAKAALQYMGEEAGMNMGSDGMMTFEQAKAVVEEVAAPDTPTARPEATPEQKIQFGKLVTSLAPEELADFQTKSEAEKLELLWLMLEADQL